VLIHFTKMLNLTAEKNSDFWRKCGGISEEFSRTKRKGSDKRKSVEEGRMAVNSLSILFKEAEKLFLEREEQITAQKGNLQERVRKIFEIGGETANLTDTDGVDDLLKLNLGGNKLDIKRSVLTKPNFGWNLFSCLFHKRWDAFHVRDKTGRIYVDLKEEWLRPLINSMIYSNGSQHVKGNLFFWYAVQSFNYDKEFHFPAFSSYGGMPIPHGFPRSLPSYLNSGEFSFQLISSTKRKLFFKNSREIDLRYKPLLLSSTTSPTVDGERTLSCRYGITQVRPDGE
jgi:hypothetical protein